ncbi:MAG: rRNA maturation RNase YbeY, partial [Clostridia bacterium]|nr:rRNA maturation RNase YbeY [Clostridia bacterium]
CEAPISEYALRQMKRVIKETVAEQYPKHKFEVNLTICDNEYIRDINREYRGIDKETDVLSFPMMDFDTPEITVILGDIIISYEKAVSQAEEYGHSLKRELCFLCCHSALHLLGYDHETEDERTQMETKQKEILERLNIKR